MFTDFTAFAIFAVVTTFTPGPNNITSLTFCLNQGYRQTVPYLFGIICGLFVVQLSIATALFWVSSTAISEAVDWMKYVGSAYIIYLAYKTFTMSINWQAGGDRRSRFIDGFLFQTINPKLYFFSVTYLTTFVNYDEVYYPWLMLTVASLASLTFVATSVWGLVGALIKEAFENSLYIRIFGAVMSLSLLYTAYLILC